MLDDVTPWFELAALDRVHREAGHHPLAIEDCFGDGVLLHRIPALARMRQALLDRGYRFVPAGTSYGAAPLLQLEKILETRTIPYQRSAPAIREVLTRAPAMSFDDATFKEAFQASYAFHESAHAWTWELACERRRQRQQPEGLHRVEVLIATEAFSMAVEAVATLTDRRRSTALFLGVNSYADPFAYERQMTPDVMRGAEGLQQEQPRALYRFLAGAFLIANLRPTAVKAQTKLACWLADWSDLACDVPMAEALLQLGLGVCLGFRTRVAPTFFRYLGLSTELETLQRRPLEASFRPGAVFHDVIDDVTDGMQIDHNWLNNFGGPPFALTALTQ